MNQDRELLALAAKAAGFLASCFEGEEFLVSDCFDDDIKEHIWKPWNPLIDGGDALSLLAKLRELYGPILLALFEDNVECGDETTLHAREPIIDGNTVAATCRAITSAAAEIGKAMA